MITGDSKKHLARFLRRRLEGRVPSHILRQLSDDELCASYQEHNAVQLRIARERTTKQDDTVDVQRSRI